MITTPVAAAATPTPSSQATNSTSTGSTSSSDASLLGSNLNTFLTLLTTQLKNQDPTSPMDTNAFTQQLVSFSEVEQQINTNKNLQSLISLQTSSEAVAALPMVGKTIQYSESTAPLSNGQASFTYTLPTTASAANLLVEDANGNVVYQTTANTSAGSYNFAWNGQTASGVTAPDGAYSLAVVAADATGKAISATVTATGKVDGVSVDNNVPTFDVGGIKVPMSDMLTVQPSSN
ncbi:MAG TPA: flagellar hook capping FlgD N-terminal domain-containing protein [Stellaceae bacterium]|nr:flagellar hook capping FlgD N-terminal domain-containing protein [Stellaceae bacterium]